MRNPKSKQLTGNFFCLTLIFLILVLFSVCKSNDKEQEKAAEKKVEKRATEILSVEKLIPVFGESTGTQSGISDLSKSQEEILISYNLYIADMSKFDEEIGTDMASKIQKFYEEFKTPDRVAFRVFVPDSGRSLGSSMSFLP